MTAYAFTGAIAKVHDVRSNDDDNSNFGPTLTLGSPTSGSTLVLLASAANQAGLIQAWDVDPTGWTFRTESLQDSLPMTGIWTKVSDGTETSVTLDSAYPATCTMLAVVELEPGWVFDAAASDDDLGSTPVSATTATLSAGAHLALTVATCRNGEFVLDSASYDRLLVEALYVTGQGGNGSIGIKDAGTGTTGFTAEANTPAGSREKALSVAVFTLPAAGGPPTGTGAASDTQDTASGTGTSVPPVSTGSVAAFPVTFTDDFNRADSTTVFGASWGGDGEYDGTQRGQIKNNTWVTINDFTSTYHNAKIWQLPTTTSAQYIEATAIHDGNENHHAVYLNLPNADPWVGRNGIPGNGSMGSDGYAWGKWAGVTNYSIYRFDGTSVASGGTAPSEIVSGTVMRLEHDGDGVLRGYVDGVQDVSYTDGSPLTGRYTGITAQANGSFGEIGFDNFSAGDLVVVESFTTDDNFGASANQVHTIPTVDNGDILLAMYGFYPDGSPAPAPGEMTTSSAEFLADFTFLDSEYWDKASGTSALETQYRVVDGTEDASYTFTSTTADSYGTAGWMLRVKGAGTPVSFTDATVQQAIPAFTTTQDNSLAVLSMISYLAVVDTASVIAEGWTLVENLDQGEAALFTKQIHAAGSYARVQVSSSTTDWSPAIVVVLGPGEGAGPTDTQDTASGAGTSVASGQTGSGTAVDASDTTTSIAPMPLKVVALAHNSVQLDWSAYAGPGSPATKYEIWRGGTYLNEVTAPTVTYTDNTVTASTPYSYYVRPVV